MSEKKHSALGISAFIISLLSSVALMVLIIIAGFLEQTTPGGVDENSIEAILLGLFLLIFLGASVVSWVLGFVALFQKHYQKIFAILAVVFSSLSLLLTLGLLAVGLMLA